MLPCRVRQCLVPVKTLIREGCSETEASWQSSNHLFGSQQLLKYLNYQTDPFLKYAQNFMQISKMEKEFQKKFLVFVIMAFEPVAGTYLSCEENSCDPQSKCYQTVLRYQI